MSAGALARPVRVAARASGSAAEGLAIAYQRLMILLLLFAGGFALLVLRLGWLALAGDDARSQVRAMSKRADLVDRNGQLLARTIDAWSVGVHPNKLLNRPEELAPKLAALMPEKTAAEYLAILKSSKNFVYFRRRAMPDLVARLNALGEPGIAYAREPERLYPQMTLAAHVIGYTDFDGRGMTGMERVLDGRLQEQGARGKPVALSIDSRVQAAMEHELARAMDDQRAVGATGVVLDARTGEVIAMASLPVYNPNRSGSAIEDARRNNVTQSVYELGSTFKPLTVAAALEAGTITNLSRRYATTSPLRVGGFTINDDHPARHNFSVPEILIHSSNIGTARIADEVGRARIEALYRKMHFDAAPDIELKERGRPLWPSYWGRTTVMTIGYGHGMAVTPLHLATAYAALVNGGIWRPATLLKRTPGQVPAGTRVFSEATSYKSRQMLRLIVTDGTGRKADADGLRVGGKTGSAEKASGGGYARTSIVATFAAAFPMDDPRYVVVTMLDEPKGSAASAGQRTAGWVIAPATGRMIARIGPLLGIAPDADKDIDVSSLVPIIGRKEKSP